MVGMRHMCAVCFAVRCVVACAAATAAQTPTAVLEGTVQDVSGGVLANAAVELRELETNQKRHGRPPTAKGVFRFTECAGRHV